MQKLIEAVGKGIEAPKGGLFIAGGFVVSTKPQPWSPDDKDETYYKVEIIAYGLHEKVAVTKELYQKLKEDEWYYGQFSFKKTSSGLTLGSLVNVFDEAPPKKASA